MEICRLCHCYIVIYVIIISSTNAALTSNEATKSTDSSNNRIRAFGLEKKPARKFSFNNLKLKKPITNTSIKEALDKRLLLKRNPATAVDKVNTPTKFLGRVIPKGKFTTPLKQRKAFQIDIPLKPQALLKPLSKQNQSVKREILNNKYVRKYSPLLKSLGVLFDDLFYPDSGESTENSKNQANTKTVSYSTKNNNVICQCTAYPKKSKSAISNITSKEKTAPSTETTTSEIALPSDITITNTTADSAPISNVGNIGSDTIIPTLPSRNTSGVRRNHSRVFKGSGSPRHRNLERNIPGNHVHGEHNTEHQRNGTGQNYDDENTGSRSGDDPSGLRLLNRTRTRIKRIKSTTDTKNIKDGTKNLTTQILLRDIGGQGSSLENEIEDKIGRVIKDTGTSTTVRPGRSISENKENYIGKPLQSVTNYTFGFNGVGQHLTDDKQILDTNSPSSGENQRIQPNNKTGLEINGLPLNFWNVDINKTNYNHVIITDSYSVATNKYGQLNFNNRTLS